jgi:hypothetical protein
LNVDKVLVQKAKLYARDEGRSLSDLVENYFKVLTGKPNATETKLTPRIGSMLGSFKLPEDFDYKKELGDEITKKYV